MMTRQQYACRLPRGLAVATQYAVRPWFPQSRAERAERKSSATCGSVPQVLSSLSAKLSVKISVVKKKKTPRNGPIRHLEERRVKPRYGWLSSQLARAQQLLTSKAQPGKGPSGRKEPRAASTSRLSSLAHL